MTTTTQATKKEAPKATKCISIIVPFGTINCTLNDNGTYDAGNDCQSLKTLGKLDLPITSIKYYNAEWVTINNQYETPVTARHGNSFP